MGYEGTYKDGIYYSPVPAIPRPRNIDATSYIFQEQDWGSVALVDAFTDESLTYGELKRNIDTVASGLAQLGMKQGDIVMICMPNSIQFPVMFFAVASLGAVVTTVNPINSIKEILRQAKDSGAAFLATCPELREKLAALNLPLILVDDHREKSKGVNPLTRMSDLLKAAPGKVPKVTIKDEDTAIILYSSGTTGLSKGVLISHKNMVESMVQRTCYSQFEATEIQCVIVPFFHVMGLCVVMANLLRRGSKLIVFPKFEFPRFLEAIQRYKITHLGVVPPIMVALSKSPLSEKYDLSSVKVIGFGAAPSGPDALVGVRNLIKGVQLRQGYGMTETTGAGAGTLPEDEYYACKHGSCGTLFPNTEAKIVDVSTGKPLPPRQEGELWLRADTVMKGYLNNEKATKETLDEEGWLHTGDLGYFDENGFLYIVDRLKELIKYNGYQVAPAELEGVLLNHPEIIDTAVVPFPEETVGEIPVAFVVRRPGSSLTADAVMKFVADQVSPYKRVRKVSFVESIPKLESGKILRRDLKNLLASPSKL